MALFNDWTYRQDITLPTNSATITDFVFPLYCSGASDTKTLNHSIFTQAYIIPTGEGRDVIFADGDTRLESVELLFEPAKQMYRFDIRIPVYTSGKTITAYWGNPFYAQPVKNPNTYPSNYKLAMPFTENYFDVVGHANGFIDQTIYDVGASNPNQVISGDAPLGAGNLYLQYNDRYCKFPDVVFGSDPYYLSAGFEISFMYKCHATNKIDNVLAKNYLIQKAINGEEPMANEEWDFYWTNGGQLVFNIYDHVYGEPVSNKKFNRAITTSAVNLYDDKPHTFIISWDGINKTHRINFDKVNMSLTTSASVGFESIKPSLQSLNIGEYYRSLVGNYSFLYMKDTISNDNELSAIYDVYNKINTSYGNVIATPSYYVDFDISDFSSNKGVGTTTDPLDQDQFMDFINGVSAVATASAYNFYCKGLIDEPIITFKGKANAYQTVYNIDSWNVPDQYDRLNYRMDIGSTIFGHKDSINKFIFKNGIIQTSAMSAFGNTEYYDMYIRVNTTNDHIRIYADATKPEIKFFGSTLLQADVIYTGQTSASEYGPNKWIQLETVPDTVGSATFKDCVIDGYMSGQGNWNAIHQNCATPRLSKSELNNSTANVTDIDMLYGWNNLFAPWSSTWIRTVGFPSITSDITDFDIRRYPDLPLNATGIQ
jgi:hypothetical protein